MHVDPAAARVQHLHNASSTRRTGECRKDESLPVVLLCLRKRRGQQFEVLERGTRVHFFPGLLRHHYYSDLHPARFASSKATEGHRLSSLRGCTNVHEHFFRKFPASKSPSLRRFLAKTGHWSTLT